MKEKRFSNRNRHTEYRGICGADINNSSVSKLSREVMAEGKGEQLGPNWLVEKMLYEKSVDKLKKDAIREIGAANDRGVTLAQRINWVLKCRKKKNY